MKEGKLIEQRHKRCGGKIIVVYGKKSGIEFACQKCLKVWKVDDNRLEKPREFRNYTKKDLKQVH